MDLPIALLFALLGALIGSFTNVLIYRLPRRESIAFPPSHCPHCQHRLHSLDLIPVLSWAALGGRCRYCRAPISPRYPLVELLTAAGYFGLALAFPWSAVGFSLVGLCLLLTLLLAASFIDAETFTIPDELTLPGVALGLLFGLVSGRSGAAVTGLPDFAGAVHGALLGAGILATINLLGAWVLRRFRERRYPEFPLGYQQIALALAAGAWLGPWWGALVGLVSVLLNLLFGPRVEAPAGRGRPPGVFAFTGHGAATERRPVRIPEFLTLGLFVLSLVVGASSALGPGLINMVQWGLAAAGLMALIAGAYWWTQPDPAEREDDDPEAMGFGDVKLAAVIGAFLGWEKLLLALALAVVVGAVLGLMQLALRRENRLKFGPYLAMGAVIALLFGNQLIGLYLSWLGA